MKDSGIEWIGEIPKDWEVRKLRVLGNFTASGIDKKVNDNEIQVRIINYTDVYGNKDLLLNDKNYMTVTTIHEKIKEHQVLEGDLIFTPSSETTEDIGVSALVNEFLPNTCFSYHVLRYAFKYEVYKQYKKYLCNNQYIQNYFSSKATGSIRKTLNRDDFKEAKVLLPPLAAQQRIADYLDEKCADINAVIEKTKATIEEYKKYKQSVITETVTKGLNSNVKMKDSGIEWIGEIPKQWEVKTLTQIFKQVKNKNIGLKEKNLLSLSYGKIIKKDINSLGGLLPDNFEGYNIIENGNIVLRLTDLQNDHTSLRVGLSTQTGIITSAYVTLINQSENFCEYLYLYLHSFDIYKGFYGMGSGVRQGLTFDGIKYLKFVIPPIKEQDKIVAYIRKKEIEIDTLIEKKQAIITELENYKKSLIYECVTGKREIIARENKDAETVIFYPYFPSKLNATNPRFAQAVLISKILDMSGKGMGRVKLEKVLFTIEHSIGFDFDTQYVREVAGPLDASIYKCENIICKKNKWYSINSSKYGISYQATINKEKYKKYYNKYFSDYDVEIERIVNTFKNYNTDQSEIIATLYGVWNDFIIDKKTFTDDDIVDDVLNNWNDSKKRFSKDVWFRAIENMRSLNIIPKGYGKRTVTREVKA